MRTQPNARWNRRTAVSNFRKRQEAEDRIITRDSHQKDKCPNSIKVIFSPILTTERCVSPIEFLGKRIRPIERDHMGLVKVTSQHLLQKQLVAIVSRSNLLPVGHHLKADHLGNKPISLLGLSPHSAKTIPRLWKVDQKRYFLPRTIGKNPRKIRLQSRKKLGAEIAMVNP